MAIKFFNTLSGKKEEFKPLQEGKVGIYLCGPTVYDEPHIGHARSAYVFEVIRRYFQFKGYKVRFVRNVTDVDDKIINKAREQESSDDIARICEEIAEKYYNIYSLWMSKMGISPPDIEPRATEHIPEMQELISTLIDKGYAYVVDGDVYFRVKKFKDYGRLSRRSVDEMIAGARIEPGEKKEEPLDFALWKKAKPQEPSWDSPWGRGRPGWHIECSVMSTGYLGVPFDIHCGGIDLIFPHHENEIAQSQAATGKEFARYWLHNGLLTINGQKMAKSLGNFITVEQVLTRYHPDVLKLFFLTTNYRSPIDFTWEKLDELAEAKEKFDSFLSRTKRIKRVHFSSRAESRNNYSEELNQFRQKFIQAMDDDFNTAVALGVLYEIVNLGNKILEDISFSFVEKNILLSEIRQTLLEFGKIFCLFLQASDDEGYNQLVEKVIAIREILRKEKRFELADRIREELMSLGIVIEDGKDKTTWRKGAKVR